MTQGLPSYILLVGLMSGLPCKAFAMEERISLMLIGPACTQGYATIDNKLTHAAGVRHVDLQTVPGHVLVDIETGVVTAEALETQVNDILVIHAPCRAKIMKSCISADPRTASTRIP